MILDCRILKLLLQKNLIASRIPVVEELLNEYHIFKKILDQEILKTLKIFEKTKFCKRFLSENNLNRFSEERMSKNYHRVINLFFRN